MMTISRIASFLIVLLTFTACSKEDDSNGTSNPNTPPVAGTLKATVGQSDFNSDNATARYRSTGEFTVTASTDNGEEFLFVISGFAGALDYSFGAAFSNSARYTNTFNGAIQGFNTSNGGFGVLSVTNFNEVTGIITGTFSFTLTQSGNAGNVLEVTEGSFSNVPILDLKEPEPGAMTYYFSDVYGTTTAPLLDLSSALRNEFELISPFGGLYRVRLKFYELDYSRMTAQVEYLSQFRFLEVSEYSVVDNKLSAKLSLPVLNDFELRIKD